MVQFTDTKSLLKNMTMVHITLMSGIILFTLIDLYLKSVGFSINETDENFKNIFLMMALLISIPSIGFGTFFYNKYLKNAKDHNNVFEKLQILSQGLIIQKATIEGAAMFNLVAFLLFGDYLFMVIPALVIIYFVLNIPNKEKIIKTLNLTMNEQIELEK